MAGSVPKGMDAKSVQAPRTPFTGHGLKVEGGRTRIRTRVFGLEGQSDIQLHYTSLFRWQGQPLMKVQQEDAPQSGLAHL